MSISVNTDDLYNELDKIHEAYKRINQLLLEADIEEWMYCDCDLTPPENEAVLIYTSNEDMCTAVLKNNTFISEFGIEENVIAWRYLPKPPKEKNG